MSIVYNFRRSKEPAIQVQEIIRNAQSLMPYLRSKVDEVTRERGLIEETRAQIRSTGLARILQPARHGGAEAGMGSVMDVLIPAACACPSTAWCLVQYILHNFMVARYAPEAQDEVWCTPDALISGSIIPKRGRACLVDGGYRLTGRWPFVSGVVGSDWCLIAAMLERENMPDEEFYFLVRTREVEILDTWHSIGLKGSGSQDIQLNDFFVPEAFGLASRFFQGGESPGSGVNAAAVFKLPVFAALGLPHAACLIGMAESMFELFLSQSRRRRSLMTDQDPANYQTHQMAVGEISASLQAAQALLRADADEMAEFAEADQTPTALERSNYRCNAAFAGELARRAAHSIWDLVGARGVYENNPIARVYQDMLVASRHVTMNLQINATDHGRARLRLPLMTTNI